MDGPHPPQCGHWGACPYPLCRCATSSLPLLAFGHFPLTWGIGPLIRGVGPPGGGLRTATWCRPYGESRSHIFFHRGRSQTVLPITDRLSPARQGQARYENRICFNFPPRQAPVGREETQIATQILRAGNFAKSIRYASPVIGVWGKAVIGERSSPLRRPPASFGSFSTWKRNSPPGRRNSPKAQKTLTPPTHPSGSDAGRTGQRTSKYKPRIPAKTAPGPAPS